MVEPYSKVRKCPFECSYKNSQGRCEMNQCLRDNLKEGNLKAEDTTAKLYVSTKPTKQV